MSEIISLNPFADFYRFAQQRSLTDFLLALDGPSLITLTGRDTSRCRAVVTLLHGNEPSGLNAILTLAQQQIIPEVTLHFIIASTAAAATPPLFSHRMLPGQPDLNRCFNTNQEGTQFRLARAITSTLKALKPECVIDLHNTSGSGPAFCVSTQNTRDHQALASCFTNRMIITDIRLGSLMEQALGCPVVTIEAGGAGDNAANKTAYEGVRKLCGKSNVFTPNHTVELLRYPRRLELKEGYSIAYVDGHDSATDVCLRTDIESLNFGKTPADTHLGWVGSNCLSPFTLDADNHTLPHYFKVDEQCISTAIPLQFFMITTNVDIARADCLFYFCS